MTQTDSFCYPPASHSRRGDERKRLFKNQFCDSVCCATVRLWWRLRFAQLECFIYRHHWKVLSSCLLLALLLLGLKLIKVDVDFENLWIEKSDRLVSEWAYLDGALQQDASQAIYPDSQFGPDTRRSRLMMLLSQSQPSSGMIDSELAIPNRFSGQAGARKFGSSSTGLPGHEFMGTMESILQTSISSDASAASKTMNVTNNQHLNQLLTPRALLDHVDFMVKVRRLQVTVGSSKWSFKDLCQRATLPFGAEMHHIQAYLDMLIPCMVITPLDCFWEGSKVLGPEEAMWVPWFNERTLVQWTNIDPIGLLEGLRAQYGNYSHNEVTKLINLFRTAGINHGYLNRSCLDPNDPACPSSAPNYRSQPPNVPQILSGGCPGFAANLLHWPEELIVGGRVHLSANSSGSQHFSPSLPHSVTSNASAPVLIFGNAIQSLIMLRSPRDLYDAVRHSDPYRHEGWTLADAQHVLDEWRRNLRQLVVEYNAGLSPNSEWCFYAFTDNSLRDLLRELTLRFGPIKFIGCILLVFLYGLLCLLDWRDPVQSQCWLALSGFLVATFASVAGLGICATVGLPFNVFTIQVLPFLVMGLSVDSVFTLTTCYQCCLTRRTISSNTKCWNKPSLTPWASVASVNTCSSSSTSDSSLVSLSPIPVLSEHGPSLLFGTIAIAGAFFSASYIPVPLMQQFCIQAGTLVLVHSACLLFLFPGLLKLDLIRRSAKRLDVLCCLQQPHTDSTSAPLGSCLHDTDLVEKCQSHSKARTSVNCYPTILTTGTESRRWLFHNRTTFAPTESRPCSSIQVSVVNRVSDHTHSNKPGWCESHSFGTSSPSRGHTVHTTITVSGPTPGLECDDRVSALSPSKQRDRPSSTKLQSFRASSAFSHRSPRCRSGWCQHSTYTTRVQPSFIAEEYTQPKPLLARFAHRLALFLTYHWLIPLFICVIGVIPFISAGLLSQYGLRLGLDWSSLIPTDAIEYGFVKHSEEAFGLRNFQVIARGTDLPGDRPVPSHSGIRNALQPTPVSGLSSATFLNRGPVTRSSFTTVGRGIDFPVQQRQLHQLYTRLSKLPHVMLAGRKYWLEAMRDWLQSVQDAFDSDRRRGLISSSGHWSVNASELGVLGLRLIVQTDRGPELSRISTGRLVHGGIVDPPAFYVLLRMWRTHDALNFSSLACVIHPEPSLVQLNHLPSSSSGRPTDLHTLPPAEPIEFIQTNYYAVGIRSMPSQLDLVQNVRLLTEAATAQGVPSFPVGAPFTFAEHYLYLIRETIVAIGIFFAVIFVAAFLLFASPLIVLLLSIVGAGGGLCAALCGMVLLGLELNPISACLLLFSAGFGARTAVGFLGSWPTPHRTLFFPAGIMTGHAARQTSGNTTCICQNARYDEVCAVNRSSSDSGSRQNIDSEDHSTDPSAIVMDVVPTNCAKVTSPVGPINPSTCYRFTRAHLVATLSNQFGPILHSTIGLVLATVLLAAARVQFIADHFFFLLMVVSFCSLFNAVCLIPALCYLIHPVHQFLLPASFSCQRPIRVGDRMHSRDGKLATRDTVFHAPASQCQSSQVCSHGHASLLSSQSSSLTPTPSTFFPPSSNQSVPPVETKCASTQLSQNPKSPVTLRIATDNPVDLLSSASAFLPASQSPLVQHTHAQLYNLCNRRLLELPSMYQQSPEAAAAATAAVVAAVAAAANSVRSRPASLSTISEEPSHASSTLSLNCTVPSVTNMCSRNTYSGSTISDADHIGERGKIAPKSPFALPDSGETLNLDESTSTLYREILRCLPPSRAIPSGSFSHVPPECVNPHYELARNLLTLAAFTGHEFGASGEAHASRHPIERSPPPPYSSVVTHNASARETTVLTSPKTQTSHSDPQHINTLFQPPCSSHWKPPNYPSAHTVLVLGENHFEPQSSPATLSLPQSLPSLSTTTHHVSNYSSGIAFHPYEPRSSVRYHRPSRLRPLVRTLSDTEARIQHAEPQTRDL